MKIDSYVYFYFELLHSGLWSISSYPVIFLYNLWDGGYFIVLHMNIHLI